MTTRKDPLASYEEKVVRHAEGCWEWKAAVNAKGYGTVSVSGRPVGAHRFAYEAYVGPIPPGLFVLHRCDNPPCTRPDHLFVGSQSENQLDCLTKGRSNLEAKVHRGEDHGGAKLTWDAVREIRRRRMTRTPGRRLRAPNRIADIAQEFGVTDSLISQIVAGRIWREEVMPNV